MSFPPATEMVQFAGFASSSYGFTAGYPKRGGLPHSDISGSTVARTSPGLFAACHVLHRLSVPRHPPDALTSRSPTPSPKHARAENRGQTTEDRPDVAETPFCSLFSGTCSLEPMRKHRSPMQGASALAYPCPDPAKTDMAGPASRFHDSLHDVREQRTESREQTRRPVVRALGKLEEAGVGRPEITPFVPSDPPFPTWGQVSAARPPVMSSPPEDEDPPREPFRSLISVLCPLNLVGLGRLERPTSRLSGVRSNQLSYRPSQITENRRQIPSGVRRAVSLCSVLCRLSWKGCVDGDRGRVLQMSRQMPRARTLARSVICHLSSDI